MLNLTVAFVLKKSKVGWMWIQLRLGFSVAFSAKKHGLFMAKRKATESIDKRTFVIYLQGPERLTKMNGNKASCYFLTAVQTFIDRNLALQIKMRLWVADVKATGHCVLCVHVCFSVHLLVWYFTSFHSWRPWSFYVSTWALTINLQ